MPRPDCRGFSLIEVLVAFSILVMMLAVVLRIFSGGLRNAALASEYSRAASAAESVVARIGSEIPVAEGQHGGQVQGTGFRWHVDMHRFQQANDDKDRERRGRAPLYRVDVAVRWGEGQRQRSVTLSTLRFGSSD